MIEDQKRRRRTDIAIDLFEYTLQSVVMHRLAPQFEPPQKQVIQYYALRALIPDIAVVLSALAYLGVDEPAQAQAAFERGAATIFRAPGSAPRMLDQSRCTLDQVDASLKRLCKAVPQIKKNTLNACAHTVAADGTIESREAELLRAIAATLDCPLPPFVA